jgi:hypothetical protein
MPLMAVFGEDGVEHVNVRGARARSLVGEHWSAVEHFLRTGDESRLIPLRGKTVEGIRLETDPAAIEEWDHFGELQIEDIYELGS